MSQAAENLQIADVDRLAQNAPFETPAADPVACFEHTNRPP